MKKRLIATLLAISTILSLIPGTAIAAGKDDVTITVVDENGAAIADSALSVKVTHVYGSITNRTQNVTVTNSGGGVFVFDGSKYDRNNTKYYTVTASLKVDGRTYTATQQISKDTNSVVLTLEDFVQGDKWVSFDVYYIADGHFPESFYGAADAKYYGPAGDNTPLLSINVNVTELQKRDGVLYQENVGNAYHFVPEAQSENEDPDIAHQENLAYVAKFWEQVKLCMDEASKEAFEATGLYDTYMAYCLKNQGSASRPDNHCDGILSVEPPVYVIEMYDHQGAIFGGYTDDVETSADKLATMEKVLNAYNKHFNQNIEWTDNGSGVWSGSYITTENGRNYKYNLAIKQTNILQANGHTSPNGIKYQKKTDTYYLAAFQSETQSRELVDCIVTYTDGVKDLVFNDHTTSLSKGAEIVPFAGSTDRENFIFEGWVLEGGDGTILSQQDILDTYASVNEDLTFVAVYTVAPSKYLGTVQVILNGTYDFVTGIATGEKIDITTVTNENISLYVSADGVEFIPLSHASTGVYTASLLNGTYAIYYYNGTDYIRSSEQYLSINNADRTRYIFFNSVSYDLNGGVGGPASLMEYYPSEAAVNVTNAAPTRAGCLFTGWKDQDGNLYTGGAPLTAANGKAYILTAQWVDAADIYVNVTINHDDGNGHIDPSSQKDDVTFDIVFAPDYDTPYLETGDRVELSAASHNNFTKESTDSYTKYRAINPVVSDVVKAYLYSAVVSKHNYNLTSVTTTLDASGDIYIDIVLDYAPQNKDLEFEVRVENVPEGLAPRAAIVKVLAWSSENNCWQIIAQHLTANGEKHPGVRVDLNGNIGTGSYPVWVNEVMGDGTVRPYGYRIIVTSIIYPDGSIIEVNNDLLADLTKNNTDLYTITFGDVADGRVCGGLNGAYFADDLQMGKLEAVITTQGYNVIFDANGGKVNGYDEQKLENQYKVPGFEGYVPTRSGGYVFDGWYLDAACTIPGQAGAYLKEDVTLYAKWKEPLKIEGFITVAGTYEQTNSDGSVTIQVIHPSDLVNTVVVILQKIHANGYTETIAEQVVTLDYNKTDYYFQGRKVGFAEYSFAGIPDNLENYRIQVLIPNYTSTFQNESDSIDKDLMLDYPKYNLTDFVAEFGGDKVANVNVHSHFEPKEFELEYSVNAEQIGEGFRPQDVEVLITYDANNAGVAPNKWTVISQMIFGDKMIGDLLTLENGVASGSDLVWISHPNGVTNYKYGLALHNITLANGNTVSFSDKLPFYVEYQAPAYYLGNAQNQELIAVLIPKTFNVIYNLNGGVLSGTYPTTHTWSYETSIAGLVPTFDGFKFDGWYLDEDFTIPAEDIIDASVAEDTVLHAKWIQVMDVVDLTVTIDHTQVGFDGGLATNYDKVIYTQLTYAERSESAEGRVFVDMPGYSKEYSNSLWHNRGDQMDMDVLEVPKYYTHLSSEYDYDVTVSMEGYYITEKTVEKVEQADGSTLHKVNVTLQYKPDLFDLEFYVTMADSVPQDAYPQSVEVKVLSWYEGLDEDTTWEWDPISQHDAATVTVAIDPATGYGEGSYPAWHWFDEEKGIAYYYRLEVVRLNWADGRSVVMNELVSDVSYGGGGYNAEIKVDSGALPVPNDREGTTTLSGVYAEPSGASHVQVGTLGAVIGINKVNFHANNGDALGDDIFRTYYPAGSLAEGSALYSLNADGTITPFYQIPEFEYTTHNNYVFKGWYLDADSTDRPLNWNDTYEGNVDVYAHWIETGTVEKEAGDTKKTPSNTYLGFNLIGVQIRDKDADHMAHYGNPASGLRFVTVLSEELYGRINAISGQNAEYGFIVAKSSSVANNMGETTETLQYNGTNVNGVDTTDEYYYVKNFKCSGVADHYDGEAYRLFTAVITYTQATGDELERQYNERITARAYIRYYDANGMLRTHYNNYLGTYFYGGCSTSFAEARALVQNH